MQFFVLWFHLLPASCLSQLDVYFMVTGLWPHFYGPFAPFFSLFLFSCETVVLVWMDLYKK